MSDRYRSGRIAERKVMNRLEELGYYNLARTKGSRGPYDIYARSPAGIKHYFQVKSGSARLSSDEIERLRQVAYERRGVAVTVERRDGKNKFRFRGSWY